MTRRSIVTLFLILIVPSTFYPQRVKKPQRNQVLKFDVPVGRTVRGFTYSREGRLSYRGESFRPSVAVNSSDVTKFSVFFFHSKNLAGVIAMDVDGQNKSFLLDLNDFSSLPMRLLDQINDPDSLLNKTISASKKGVAACQKVGKIYNKFAQWLGMPQVPDIFL